MNADAAGRLADASANFEESSTQSFDLRRAPGRRKLQQAKQVDQVVGKAVQEQTKGIGQKAVTTEPVGAEAVLELLDTVFAFAAVIVKGEDFRRTAQHSW